MAVVSLSIVGLAIYVLFFSSSTTIYEALPCTAAIVDQLSLTHPNSTFVDSVNSTLASAGYSVDYYNYSQVTVDFYKQLPSKRYSIIILRVHSGVGRYSGLTSLYTSEVYGEFGHYLEQSWKQVVAVEYVENGPKYFAITSELVKASDGCRGLKVIMMGCDGLKKDDLAKAYVEKGADFYVSWNGSVSPQHTDVAVNELLHSLVSENQTVGNAVSSTMDRVGLDPNYGSTLAFYPSEAAEHLVVGELSGCLSTFYTYAVLTVLGHKDWEWRRFLS